jgi:MFS family permease
MKRSTLTLILLTSFLGNLSIYFITPALPQLSETFISSPRLIQLTISLFLLGKAASMFFCCYLSERLGRRPIYMSGLLLYSFSNGIAAAAENIYFILICRLLQGFAVGATLLMGRCMINDLQEEQPAMRQFAWLFALSGVIICFLPWLGAMINNQLGWRSAFLIASAYGATLLVFSSTLPETHSNRPQVWSLQKSISFLFKNKLFVGYLTISALMMAGESAFNTCAPFILIKEAHFSLGSYGQVKTMLALMHLLGTATCGLLIRYIQSASLVGIGVAFFATTAGFMLFFCSFNNSLYLNLIIPMMLYYFGTGFIITSAAAAAVRPFPEQMALAMAMALFFQFSFSAGFSFIASLLEIETAKPLIGLISLIGLLSIVSWKELISRPSAAKTAPQ